MKFQELSNKILYNRKILLYLCAIVFVLKVVFSVNTGFSGTTVEDWRIAQNIANSGQFSEFLAVGPTTFKLPIYPLFLAGFIKIFGADAKAFIVIFQHLILVLSPLIFIEIFKFFGKEKIAWIGAILFLLSPSYFIYSNVIEATNIFIPIFALWLWQAARIYQKSSDNKDIIFFGVLSALLALTQAVAIPIMCLCALVMYKRIGIKKIAYILGLAILFYSPWVIRNYIAFDKFIPSKSPRYQNIYLGYLSSEQFFNKLKLVPDSTEERIANLRIVNPDIQMESVYKNVIDEINKNHPSIFVEKYLANIFYLWYVPNRYIDNNTIAILIGRKLFVIIINILALLAIARLWKENRKIAILIILSFALFSAPYMLTQAINTRFKLDFEWMQLLLIAYYLKGKLDDKFQKQVV